MSFLAPWFALGVLAISLPLIFHLIQRRPRGQREFSSLMFLRPSPPQLTRRSRLDNWLLLLLRALALILLAVAFTRPLWRSFALLALDTPARRIVVLLDTSASMQRAGLWEQARGHVNDVVADLRPTDQIAVYAFDKTTRPVVRFEDVQRVAASGRQAVIRGAVDNVSPSFHATDLGQALVTAADLIQTAVEGTDRESALPPQIVLVTDLQEGVDLGRIDGYEWPKEARVDIRRVTPERPTNASFVVLAAENESQVRDHLRVKVSNAADSGGQQFRLGWADSDGRLLDDREYSVHVQPGQSHVVRVDLSGNANRLTLIGDDQPFDNVRFVARSQPAAAKLLFLESAAAARRRESIRRDPNAADAPAPDLWFYLARMPLDTARYKVEVESRPAAKSLDESPDPNRVPLVVSDAALPPATVQQLQAYMQKGGRVLIVLARPADQLQDMLPSLRQLTSLDSLNVEEAELGRYAMLAQIDFQHALFRPFADPRFSDFTKTRFWAHRRLLVSHEQPWDVLARFDNEAPALVERVEGQGRLWILASGWQPDDSQLALSSKFVPLLAGMFDPRGGRPLVQASYQVGQVVTLPATGAARQIAGPDDSLTQVAAEETEFGATERPGLYHLVVENNRQPFAVNLAAAESRTAALDPQQLEQRGVRLGKARTMQEIQDQQRQLRDVELEGRQRLWQWLIAAALCILILETWLGGWLARRKTAVAAEAGA